MQSLRNLAAALLLGATAALAANMLAYINYSSFFLGALAIASPVLISVLIVTCISNSFPQAVILCAALDFGIVAIGGIFMLVTTSNPDWPDLVISLFFLVVMVTVATVPLLVAGYWIPIGARRMVQGKGASKIGVRRG